MERSIYNQPEKLQTSIIRAVILDYDGTIVDTENVWFQTCVQVCNSYGVNIGEEYREKLMRSSLSSYLKQEFLLPDEVQEIRKKVYGTFDLLTINGIQTMPGAIQLIELLKERYPLAIASGSNTQQILESLEKLGIKNDFQAVIGADQVQNPKPAPDLFLLAAKSLKADPHECLVIEDAPKGIIAAKAANMRCLAVPNRYLKNVDYTQYNPDAIVNSLEEVSLEFIGNLAKIK